MFVQAGAEVNVLNDMGDTPLHRAAFTGRKVRRFRVQCLQVEYLEGQSPVFFMALNSN